MKREERLSTVSSLVSKIDQSTNSKREREAIDSVRQGLQDRPFDIFLCHNSEDKSDVKKMAKQLQEHGFRPWLDEWELRPGLPWQRLLEAQIEQMRSAAVFVGAAGIHPWQRMELEAFPGIFVEQGKPVIPVLLESAPQLPQLPPFLR